MLSIFVVVVIEVGFDQVQTIQSFVFVWSESRNDVRVRANLF